MKDFIGIKCKVMVDGVKMCGTVVGDEPTRFLLVEDSMGPVPIRVIKGKVSFFQPEREPEVRLPMLMLCCRNPATRCPGVQYVMEGESASRRDFEAFMGPCPSRRHDCKCGSKGDVRTVPGDYLRSVLAGVVFGDYPEKKGGGDGERERGVKGEDGEAAAVQGAGGGRKVSKGQAVRRAGGPQETDG